MNPVRDLAVRKDRLSSPQADVLWIVLAAVLAILPLLVHGNSCGHDFSFHLLNWMEVVTQWQHGILRPWWAFHAAFNAGEPRFVFYPPLSWVLGALLGLTLPWSATPIAYTFVTLVLCGLTMRTLLRSFVAPTIAVAGACLYVSNPYMLFVAMERTAYAELLAAAWMPLLLLAALRLKLKPLQLAAAVALLWLTNAPAAVVGCYSLLCLGVVRVVFAARDQGRFVAFRQAVAMTWGTALGLAAASFYLIPAIVQRRLVQIDMAVLPGMRPTDSFLFQHTADEGHDAVLRSASWIAVGTLAVAAACILLLLLRARSRHRSYASMRDRAASVHHAASLDHTPAAHPAFLTASLTVLVAIIAFLLTRWSTPLWHHAPELAFLQFPWRFLSIASAIAVLLLCLAANTFNVIAFLRSRPARLALLALTLGIVYATTLTAYGEYEQACDEEDPPAFQRAVYLGGNGETMPTDEYTPTSADNDALKRSLPTAWIASTGDAPPDPAAAETALAVTDGNPAHLHFSVPASAKQGTLVIRLRQFRGWTLSLDGSAMHDLPERSDGLFSVALPAGAPHEVDLRYRWTWDEIAGLLVSIAALLVAVLVRYPIRLARPRQSA